MAETNCASAAVQGMPPTLDAILAVGTNMGNRVENIDDAVRRLEADGSIIVVARSKLYRTAPWGVTDQDWFVNACVGVQTALSPHELLKRCQAIENDMGRVRTRHWGPRVIDVDILAIRDRQICDPDLVVPHPFIAERAFVVVPLKDVAPALTIGGKTLDDMIEALDASDVTPLQ
ncbi:2-amino-4-hydroxy-6-hydroxymethyldihydropteridine diphosphokinase [Hyphomicrobium sp. MC8b]|uniref:2-amino-4-hydroxy-6- hydroxymethyldihydropteridine diphosphokinase n=1 Tax=Hyphomicrobium sp. MC8b TaxID=300273 RepID=UPI00391A5D37